VDNLSPFLGRSDSRKMQKSYGWSAVIHRAGVEILTARSVSL
jgi:hypothetical protein